MWKFFSKVKPSPAAPRTCQRCGSTSLKRKVATHSVPLTGKLLGRRVDVYRVEHDQCRQCGFLAPTPQGQAKIKRCTKTGIEFIMKSLPYKTPPRKLPF